MNISDNHTFRIPNFEQNFSVQNQEKSPAIKTSLFDEPKITSAKNKKLPENHHILQDILAKSQEILNARAEAESFLRGQ